MAGIKLPTYQDLGTPPVPTAPDTVTPYNPVGPYQAAAQQAKDVTSDVNDIQDVYDKTHVNDVYANSFSPDVRQAAGDFYAKSGKDALDSYPAAQQQMADIRNQYSSGMVGPQQTMFNNLATQRLESELYRMDIHAQEQGRQYIDQTHKSVLDNQVNEAATYYNDPHAYGEALQTGISDTQGWGAKRGIAPETQEAEINDFKSKMAISRYTAYANDNVSSAYKDYQSNLANIPGDAQIRLDAFFKPKIRDLAVDNFANPDNLVKLLPGSKTAATTNPIDFVMNHEGGFVTNDSGKGPTNFGINQEANPDVDVKNLTSDQARNIIQTKYANAIGADKMSPEMATVAVDSAVNMGVQKTQQLLAQAGNDPQKLIDLRRTEYQRLATNDPARYAQYLPAWNARLDDLQKTISQTSASPADNPTPTSAFQTTADAMAANRPALIQQGIDWARQNYPNDPTMENSVRQRIDNTISAAVQSQTANYRQDNQKVMQAITGNTPGTKQPGTFQELQAMPGMQDTLNRVAVQDSHFYEGIDHMIAQNAKKDTTTNSANGYGTVMRVLDTSQGGNQIDSQDHLDKQLGLSDGTGINMKDYNDAKPALDASDTMKNFLRTNMAQITNANGNVDGQGQQRAMTWYNQVMNAKSANDRLGDKAVNESNFISNMKDSTVPHQPGVMDQISNWAASLKSGSSTPYLARQKDNQPIPTFSDPNDPRFAALPSGSQFMVPGEAKPRIKK